VWAAGIATSWTGNSEEFRGYVFLVEKKKTHEQASFKGKRGKTFYHPWPGRNCLVTKEVAQYRKNHERKKRRRGTSFSFIGAWPSHALTGLSTGQKKVIPAGGKKHVPPLKAQKAFSTSPG